METIELADYIQYGFMAFMSLLLIAMFVALLRLMKENGEIKGELKGINNRLDDLSDRVGRSEERIGRLETAVASLNREIGELKGLLVALHQRVDLGHAPPTPTRHRAGDPYPRRSRRRLAASDSCPPASTVVYYRQQAPILFTKGAAKW